MKCLNLYAGLGGNRKKWPATVQVTSVEKNEQVCAWYRDRYPADNVVCGDAISYLQKNFSEFDFIWSSPPCQSHSFMKRHGRHATPQFPDLRLYEQIIFLSEHFRGKWVVENVRPYYEPLLKPQKSGRHLFWANFIIPSMEISTPANIMENSSSRTGRRILADWLGIDYDFSIRLTGKGHPEQALKNCVHPDLGLHVFNAAMSKQVTLF